MALKYLKREEMSEEEIKELEKMYATFLKRVTLSFFGYMFAGFWATIAVVIVNNMYVKNDQFQFFAIFGTVMIFLSGLQGTIAEHRDILVREAQKFVKD